MQGDLQGDAIPMRYNKAHAYDIIPPTRGLHIGMDMVSLWYRDQVVEAI